MIDPLPPVFWERYLADLRRAHADAATDAENHRSALESTNVGVEPLIDLIHRLADELAERHLTQDDRYNGDRPRYYCKSCALDEGDSYGQWQHAPNCPLQQALNDAEQFGWER